MNAESPPLPTRRISGQAKASVVLGLLSLLFCFPGPVAIVFGVIALLRIANTPLTTRGAPLAVLGIVLGLAGTTVLPWFVLQHQRHAIYELKSNNNMRQLGLAMHNYSMGQFKHDFRGDLVFPSPQRESGELSWRVSLLPYLENSFLYESLDKDAAWNSPQNQPYTNSPNTPFHSPLLSAVDNRTVYLQVVGPGTFNDPNTKMKDGRSTMAMIVEADEQIAVPWAKPGDWTFDPANPKQHLGRLRGNGFAVVMVDGSVHFLANDIDPAVWKAICTAAGGEQPNYDFERSRK